LPANRDEVTFYSGPQLKLYAELYTPDGTPPDGGHPAVVLCLGYRPVFGMFAPKYAQYLAERGYAVLAFEYRGFGRSEGPKWRHIAHEQLEDVRNAVSYLASLDQVDAGRIAVWGDASFGGAHAVMAGALDDRVRCVVATTPFADGEALLRSTRAPWEWEDFMARVEADRRARVNGAGEDVRPEVIINFEPASHVRAANHAKTHPELGQLMYPLSETTDAILAYKPVEAAAKLDHTPILVIGAELDRTVPIEHSRMLYDAATGPKKLVVLRGAGHSEVHGARLEQVIDIGLDWFATHLAPLVEDETKTHPASES
jgi:dipeptidyl aminopeptidase/acylaminoacyl peptidase